MTFAKRIEFFDGAGIRQTNDAFIVSMGEMEVVKQFAYYLRDVSFGNPRFEEFADNWITNLEKHGVKNISIFGDEKKDGRLCPQYNTERKEG